MLNQYLFLFSPLMPREKIRLASTRNGLWERGNAHHQGKLQLVAERTRAIIVPRKSAKAVNTNTARKTQIR